MRNQLWKPRDEIALVRILLKAVVRAPSYASLTAERKLRDRQ